MSNQLCECCEIITNYIQNGKCENYQDNIIQLRLYQKKDVFETYNLNSYHRLQVMNMK